MDKYDLVTIIGPTASGKTSLACLLAYETDSEIISGDSRQIYRSMDLGTGKDLADYIVNKKQIPYHLIDIRNAGEKYNIFEYQQDFYSTYKNITSKGKLPILCGGSGLYIESVLKGYPLVDVPENKALRESLKDKTLGELTDMLSSYKTLHNKTDIDTAQRAVRAIEIAEYSLSNATQISKTVNLNSLIIGVDIDRELRRNRISQRLRTRLDEGMVEEVRNILNSGVNSDDLIYYGLEYKYLTLYILGQLSYDDMVSQLEIAIHQFAKRQMTWFRGMEKRGLSIHWIDALIPDAEKVEIIKSKLQSE